LSRSSMLTMPWLPPELQAQPSHFDSQGMIDKVSERVPIVLQYLRSHQIPNMPIVVGDALPYLWGIPVMAGLGCRRTDKVR
jgi:hypothetical protein